MSVEEMKANTHFPCELGERQKICPQLENKLGAEERKLLVASTIKRLLFLTWREASNFRADSCEEY